MKQRPVVEMADCLYQHQTTSAGTTASMQATNGASAYGASGKYGNSAAVGQTANGNKYASANGNTYSNTGNGWSGNSNNSKNYNSSSYSGSSASKSDSAAGAVRQKAAARRPLVAVAAEDGVPGRRVLADLPAGAAVVVGAARSQMKIIGWLLERGRLHWPALVSLS